MNKKSYISKAKPDDLLCQGKKCTLRDRCLRYNLEPNEKQLWISPIPRNVNGETIYCFDFDPINKKEKP
jgi:hypothetical protein